MNRIGLHIRNLYKLYQSKKDIISSYILCQKPNSMLMNFYNRHLHPALKKQFLPDNVYVKICIIKNSIKDEWPKPTQEEQ